MATQPVQNVVWTLKLEPNATGGQVTKAVDQSADVKFTVVYSKATESVRSAWLLLLACAECGQQEPLLLITSKQLQIT